MVGEEDNQDRNDSRRIAIVLVSLLIVLALAALLLLPALAELTATHFSPGVGLKTAAIISFFVTVLLMIVFALVSGDGLLGEVQFILVGFLLFFLIFWLMVAWIF